jgi:hypothetical protein
MQDASPLWFLLKFHSTYSPAKKVLFLLVDTIDTCKLFQYQPPLVSVEHRTSQWCMRATAWNICKPRCNISLTFFNYICIDMATFKCLLHLFERNSKHMSTPSSCQANNTRGYKRLLHSNICCHSIYSKKLSEKQTSDIRCISCVSYKIVLFYHFFQIENEENHWKSKSTGSPKYFRSICRLPQLPLGFQLWHVPRVHIPLSSLSTPARCWSPVGPEVRSQWIPNYLMLRGLWGMEKAWAPFRRITLHESIPVLTINSWDMINLCKSHRFSSKGWQTWIPAPETI